MFDEMDRKAIFESWFADLFDDRGNPVIDPTKIKERRRELDERNEKEEKE